MVDVGAKPVVATSRGRARPGADGRRRPPRGSASLPKGDALTVARIAGIQAAKRTGELIPLCHPLPLTVVEVDLAVDGGRRRDRGGRRDHRADRCRDGGADRGRRRGADRLRHGEGGRQGDARSTAIELVSKTKEPGAERARARRSRSGSRGSSGSSTRSSRCRSRTSARCSRSTAGRGSGRWPGSRSRWSARGRSRWGSTGSSTRRSTPGTRAPRGGSFPAGRADARAGRRAVRARACRLPRRRASSSSRSSAGCGRSRS